MGLGGFFHGVVGILQGSGKVGLEVVLVDPFALFQVFLRMADGVAVFQDIGAFRGIVEQNLVSCWSVLQQGDGLAVNLDGLALLERAEANHYRVGRVDLDKA